MMPDSFDLRDWFQQWNLAFLGIGATPAEIARIIGG